MLKTLTELNGVSGDENRVAKYIVSQISHYADDVTIDTMGNLILYKKGKNPTDKKIAVFAHMDEVGLIVTDITDDGYLKFAQVGGIDDRILLTQKVLVGPDAVKGVIGIKAVHLQSKDERGQTIKMDNMYIDIGATSKEDAEKYVSKGQYVSFDSAYTPLYSTRIKAKALDDRAGCAIMMELIKQDFESDIFFCFTVQEETGLRGARVLSRRIEADIGFILESTTASDTAFTPKHLYGTSLGHGPVISLMDKGSYSDKQLNSFVAEIANKNNIKFQYKLTSNGGNDAREIQTGSKGCRVCSVSLPCRYIHSPVSVIDLEDYDNMTKLMEAVLKNINEFKERD